MCACFVYFMCVYSIEAAPNSAYVEMYFVMDLVQLTYHIWNTFILATAFQELGESFQSSFAIVVDNTVISLLVELQGWERCDLGMFQLIGGSINLGNHNIGVVLELVSKLIKDWGQLLAMSAPINRKYIDIEFPVEKK